MRFRMGILWRSVSTYKTHLKNVLWSNFCVELSFQFFKIQQYSCGLKLDLALILNPIPIFEMDFRSLNPMNKLWVVF